MSRWRSAARVRLPVGEGLLQGPDGSFFDGWRSSLSTTTLHTTSFDIFFYVLVCETLALSDQEHRRQLIRDDVLAYATRDFPLLHVAHTA